MVGVEYETPAVSEADGEALPYDGSHPAIREVLEDMERATRWERSEEDGRIVALRGPAGASITLEPGGQVEMSGKQCTSMHEARRELDSHVYQLTDIGAHRGIAFLGLGMQPLTPLASTPWMPKQRYRIMRTIMEKTGKLGHRMMAQTATVQGNYDYESESDARRKLRVAMALSPVLVAASANSPICDGRDTGFKSYRAHVWTDTDPARCGLLSFVFDTESVFRAYAEYAMDVPMYFVARAGRLIPAEGMTFRSFMRKGFQGHAATIADWSTHLTTIFPEARLKTYLEVRAADGQPQDRILAVPALLKGILYDGDCLDAVWELLAKWSPSERMEALASAAREGLGARFGRIAAHSITKEIAGIGREGLRRQALRDEDGNDESVYLLPLERDLQRGICPADGAIEAWRRGPARLVRYARYQSGT